MCKSYGAPPGNEVCKLMLLLCIDRLIVHNDHCASRATLILWLIQGLLNQEIRISGRSQQTENWELFKQNSPK